VKITGPFLFEHDFGKYRPILIPFHCFRQKETICPQNILNLPLYLYFVAALRWNLEKCNHIHFITETVE